MKKMIFVSNRLPITIKKSKTGLTYDESIGGLATGLKGFHKNEDALWIGWNGILEEKLNYIEKAEIQIKLKSDFKCSSVFLSKKEIDLYYNQFCNETIWPLFHYFFEKTTYNEKAWKMYVKVNQKFLNETIQYLDEDSTIWIHDYQLMLLPSMLREKFPKVKIGFFYTFLFPHLNYLDI